MAALMNPFDPSDDDLRQWAHSGLPAPVEDFDLTVASEDRAPLLVELASSPARDFALRCLYLIVGDAVRSDFNTSSRAQIEAMLADAERASSTDRGIDRWIAESRGLLGHPERFDYALWCDGGLASLAAGEPSR
jgi:hypothetical protein